MNPAFTAHPLTSRSSCSSFSTSFSTSSSQTKTKVELYEQEAPRTPHVLLDTVC